MKELVNKHFFLFLLVSITLGACVSKKDFMAMQGDRDALQSSLDAAKKQLADMESAKMDLEGKVRNLEGTVSSQKGELSGKDATIQSLKQSLETDVSDLKAKNAAFQNGLKDLSLLSEYELKKLMETLASMEGTDNKRSAASKALADNLRSSLGGAGGNDIVVSTKGSLVYVTLSDKVLFESGRSSLTGIGPAILSSVASVLNANETIDALVEGHTDSDPISLTSYKNNWDLSMKRAMVVVNELQSKYNVNPARLIPAARGEHKPKADNETEEGKKTNRRTEIILIPRVDQYLQLVSGK